MEQAAKEAAKAAEPEEALVAQATEGLDDEERSRFAALLRKKMSLEDRVDQLIALAKLNDTKRAGVGLRAIQEINAITGVHETKANESPPMFVFPDDTSVSINVQKVVK